MYFAQFTAEKNKRKLMNLQNENRNAPLFDSVLIYRFTYYVSISDNIAFVLLVLS